MTFEDAISLVNMHLASRDGRFLHGGRSGHRPPFHVTVSSGYSDALIESCEVPSL